MAKADGEHSTPKRSARKYTGFQPKHPAPTELRTDSSFRDYVLFYKEQRGLTQNKLAECARMDQTALSKILNEKTMNISVENLVRICLVLGLGREQAIDLMSRKERAFSPANPSHAVYLELIDLYENKVFDFSLPNAQLVTYLDEADALLKNRGFATFPVLEHQR